MTSFSFQLIVFSSACTDGSECPKYKPYCTPVGCSFECPRPFVVNGSQCLQSCDPWFVDKDKWRCVQSCPDGTFVNSITSPYCVSSCPGEYYINGTECVSNCGDYLVDTDGESCVPSCKGEGNFIVENLKLINGQPYMERACVHISKWFVNCDFIYNRTCVPRCPENITHVLKYGLLQTFSCVDQCPNDSQLKTKATFKSGVSYYLCVASCEHFVENGICLKRCSPDKVMLNNTCIDKCPDEFSLVSRNGECLKSCEDDFSEKVSGCQCPSERPFYQDSVCVVNCASNGLYREDLNGLKRCVSSCDDGEFLFNNSCIKSCPKDTFLYSQTCGQKCPSHMSFSCFSENGKTCSSSKSEDGLFSICLNKCPKNMFKDGSMCLDTCLKYTVNESRTCVNKCPKTFPLDVNITTGINCQWGDTCESLKKETLYCQDNCPQSMYRLDNSCVNFCGKDMKVYENICVSHCPINTYELQKKINIDNYEYDEYYSYHWKRRSRKVDTAVCVNDCGSDKVKSNSSCVDRCPVGRIYVTNGVCSDRPCTTKIVYKEPSKGPEIHCVESCPLHLQLYNNSCVSECPEDKPYNYTGVCVAICPKDKPYPLETEKKCIHYCSNQEEIFLSGKCVSRHECLMVKFNGACIETCPHNFVYWPDEDCMELSKFAGIILFQFLLIAVISFFGRRLIKEYFIVIKLSLITVSY